MLIKDNSTTVKRSLEIIEAYSKVENLTKALIVPLIFEETMSNGLHLKMQHFKGVYTSTTLAELTGDYIIIEFEDDVQEVPEYFGLINYNDREFYVYEIPEEFANDVALLKYGKLSKLSRKAKGVIRDRTPAKHKDYISMLFSKDKRFRWQLVNTLMPGESINTITETYNELTEANSEVVPKLINILN